MKYTHEIKKNDKLTLCYKESVTRKAFVGFIKEKTEACSQGTTVLL